MQSKINYEQELNPAQLEAVRSTAGPHLVIAGAGSGKTRVLVYRVAYLVENGVRPENILLLTFTRRAAQEMLRRASLLLDERCAKVSGGTFHSFAHLSLRKYARLLDLSNNFSILDESDAQDAVNLARTQLGYHKMQQRFPRKRAILAVLSKSVNKSADIEEVLYDEYPQFMEWQGEIKKIRAAYDKYKREKSLLDYDDLLVYLKELLLKHEDARMQLSRKFQYIMVDEYQDTNKLQAYIGCLLASEHKNIMVVGDDAQSIYSFRGADFKNIIAFPKIFPGAKIITLEENYRSTQPILDMTNAVIRQAKEKFPKLLFTRNKGETLPLFIDCRDEHAQSKYVAEKILELREEGVELSGIAVLFRSGWHSNDLEVELSSRDIPFVKYGGQKFVEAAHIKDVLSYLRIAYNISDAVSWQRCLLLVPGVGPKTAGRLINGIIDAKLGAGIQDPALLKAEKLRELFALFKTRQALRQKQPAELLEVFIKYYHPLLKENYDDFHKRINDLDALLRIAGRYHSLEQFLADMALEPPERSLAEAGPKDRGDGCLTLSTIHSAKGLEWHTVFLIYLAEGHLPSYLSLESEDDIEEERRLFYVAATRAKVNLFLLKPRLDRSPRSFLDGGGQVFTQVSRFLDQGGILQKFVEVKSAADDPDWDELEPEDPFPDSRLPDREFLRLMEEHFRDENAHDISP